MARRVAAHQEQRKLKEPVASIQHPFSGSHGVKKRDALARHVGQRDGYRCFMCQCSLYPGRDAPNSRVLEHLEPWRLSPDKAYDPDNIKLCCKQCHDSTCASIEAQHWGNAEMIKAVKLRMTAEWD